jgi:hypothetical protein
MPPLKALSQNIVTKTILVLAANPKDTQTLRLAEEVREIKHGLERSRQRDQFQLVQELAVRPADVRRAMLDYNPTVQEPDRQLCREVLSANPVGDR